MDRERTFSSYSEEEFDGKDLQKLEEMYPGSIQWIHRYFEVRYKMWIQVDDSDELFNEYVHDYYHEVKDEQAFAMKPFIEKITEEFAEA